MNIPMNRWTIGAVLALAALLGPDFLSWAMGVVAAMGGAYLPAG